MVCRWRVRTRVQTWPGRRGIYTGTPPVPLSAVAAIFAGDKGDNAEPAGFLRPHERKRKHAPSPTLADLRDLLFSRSPCAEGAGRDRLLRGADRPPSEQKEPPA